MNSAAMNKSLGKELDKYDEVKASYMQEAIKWCAQSENLMGAAAVGFVAAFSGAALARIGIDLPPGAASMALNITTAGVLSIVPSMVVLGGMGAYGDYKEDKAIDQLTRSLPEALTNIHQRGAAHEATAERMKEVLSMNPVKRLFTVDSDVRKAADIYQDIIAYGNDRLKFAANATFDKVAEKNMGQPKVQSTSLKM
jgi:hypothetical protein